MYSFIDNYDQFATKSLFEGHAVVPNTLVYYKSAAAASKMLCSFFGTIKAITGLSNYRTLTMGISPLAFADNSVWNVAQYLTHRTKFANMLGFTDDDVAVPGR